MGCTQQRVSAWVIVTAFAQGRHGQDRISISFVLFQVAFYSAVYSAPHPLRPYIAHFFSVEKIQGEELLRAKEQASRDCRGCQGASPYHDAHASLTCSILMKFNPHLNTVYQFLALRDVTSQLSKPCVIDIKMGRRQYGYGASESKIRSKELKTQKSTSRNLFFRCMLLGLGRETAL